MSTSLSPKDIRIKVDPDDLQKNSPSFQFVSADNTLPFKKGAKEDDNPWVVTVDTEDSEEDESFLPNPWRKVEHVILVSFISAIFCCVTASIANRYAWRARKCALGNQIPQARSHARIAVWLIYASFILGVIIIPAIAVPIILKYKDHGDRLFD